MYLVKVTPSVLPNVKAEHKGTCLTFSSAVERNFNRGYAAYEMKESKRFMLTLKKQKIVLFTSRRTQAINYKHESIEKMVEKLTKIVDELPELKGMFPQVQHVKTSNNRVGLLIDPVEGESLEKFMETKGMSTLARDIKAFFNWKHGLNSDYEMKKGKEEAAFNKKLKGAQKKIDDAIKALEKVEWVDGDMVKKVRESARFKLTDNNDDFVEVKFTEVDFWKM